MSLIFIQKVVIYKNTSALFGLLCFDLFMAKKAEILSLGIVIKCASFLLYLADNRKPEWPRSIDYGRGYL
jgi:hypothetical protein